MNKKRLYVAPSIEVTELECEESLLVASGEETPEAQKVPLQSEDMTLQDVTQKEDAWE